MSLRDAFERLDAANQVLIGSDTTLHKRLELAIVEVALLREEDVSPELRKSVTQLNDMIHTYQDGTNRSDMEPKLALAIFEVFKNLVANTGMVSKTPSIFS